MTDYDRKTSEDMIRAARDRLGEPGNPSDEQEPEPLRPEPDATPEGFDVEPEPELEPAEHVYRSQAMVVTEPAHVDPIEPQPQRRNFISGRLIVWAVIVFIGLGWGFFTSLDDADRDGSGEIVAGGDLDVMTIQVGDCFDDPDETGVVYNLDAVPCSQPHDNEVFASVPLAGVWLEYPGQSVVDGYAYEQCSGDVFDEFVGTPYFDSSLDVFTLTPTQESWDQGDREIICALYRLDFDKLTGTARDSRL
jgi:hypothetical protein